MTSQGRSGVTRSLPDGRSVCTGAVEALIPPIVSAAPGCLPSPTVLYQPLIYRNLATFGEDRHAAPETTGTRGPRAAHTGHVPHVARPGRGGDARVRDHARG